MTQTTRLVRTLLTVGAATGLLLVGGYAAPASAVDGTTSCQGVLSGAGEGSLDKSVVSVTPGANAGDYTVVYSLQSNRPAGSYRIRDCAFIDTGDPGYTGEPFVGTTDEKEVAFTSSGSGSTATFTQEVTGVDPNDQLCDRAAVSGVDAGTSFTDKSNTLCITPNNPPVVSESHLAVTLPLAGLAAVGFVLLLQRRRHRASAPDAATTA